MKALRICGAAFVVALGAGACANILSLEDAELDPALEGSGGGGSETSDGGHTHGGGGDSPTSEGGGGAGDVGGAGGELAGGGGEGGGTGPTECETYCSTVMDNCTGSFAVYGAIEVCLAACQHLPLGEAGDEDTNTVFCRLGAAQAAPAEPSFYCPAAGPGGNGVCGSNCEGLCSLAEGVCVGPWSQWPSIEECLSACSELPDLGTYSTDPADELYKGPHVQCRLYHSSSAALEDPDVHCAHVGGAAPCAP